MVEYIVRNVGETNKKSYSWLSIKEKVNAEFEKNPPQNQKDMMNVVNNIFKELNIYSTVLEAST